MNKVNKTRSSSTRFGILAFANLDFPERTIEGCRDAIARSDQDVSICILAVLPLTLQGWHSSLDLMVETSNQTLRSIAESCHSPSAEFKIRILFGGPRDFLQQVRIFAPKLILIENEKRDYIEALERAQLECAIQLL